MRHRPDGVHLQVRGEPLGDLLLGTRTLALLGLLALAGCAQLKPVEPGERVPRTAAHLFVDRPWQAIPEPDRFIQGVLLAFTEELVLGGYDFTGKTLSPGDDDDLRQHLAELNKRIPGTVGIHLEFVEAPIVVGFGTTYTSITCTVYDPAGKIILSVDLDPPEPRSIKDLLLPPKHPDVAGRQWGRRAWQQSLALVLGPRLYY